MAGILFIFTDRRDAEDLADAMEMDYSKIEMDVVNEDQANYTLFVRGISRMAEAEEVVDSTESFYGIAPIMFGPTFVYRGDEEIPNI